MGRYLLLCSSILSLFVLTWFLARWYSPANCINSTLVGKVTIVPDNDELKTCSLEVRLFDLEVSDYFKKTATISRIEQLEKVSSYLATDNSKLNVKVKFDQDQTLIFHPEYILISKDLFGQVGVLERAILFQKINDSTPLSSSSVADFLWSEVISRDRPTPTEAWINHLSTLKKYCRSENRILPHYEFCLVHSKLSDSFINGDEPEVAHWSFAPVYTNILRDIYRQLNLSEKNELLKNVLFLGEIDDSLFASIQSWRNIKKIEESFFNNIKSWLMPTLISEELIDQVLSEYSLFKNQYKYLKISRTSRDSFPVNKLSYFTNKTNGNLKSGAITQFGLNQIFYPSDVWLKLDVKTLSRDFKFKNVIYFSCQMPEVATLQEQSHLSQKVIYIKSCQESDIDWSELYASDLGLYFQKYQDTKFIEFNLNALKFAEKMRGPLKNSPEFKSWQRWLLWQKIITDDNTKIRKPMSAIDGVERFRF